MAITLATLRSTVAKDPGLRGAISTTDLTNGLAAFDQLAALLLRVIDEQNLNDDGMITAADMRAISTAVRNEASDYWAFVEHHGDDEGNVETGYHLLQNDGATLEFQGRNLVDTVADAIFHFGFKVNANGRFENEDGNENEEAADIAGWLNYFLNGENIVYGGANADELHSGDYSAALAAAASETFLAGDGDDSIWAGAGNDSVLGGTGNDKSGGQDGNDTLLGETGNDTLYGDGGHDELNGGVGNDVLGGGTGSDRILAGAGLDSLYGESGDDKLWADDGADVVYGGIGNDQVYGGAGNDNLAGDVGQDRVFGDDGDDEISGGDNTDYLLGGAGKDTIHGGEARDVIWAGAGADQINLWEMAQASDRLIFKSGDSGKTRGTIDQVEGFKSGIDKIDLTAFKGMVLEDLDYRGGGTASAYFDGRHLRLDTNGDAVTDMIIGIKWVDDLVAGDFLFA